MHSHPALHLTWRFTVGLVGSVVLLGGVVMCVTPGPGIGGVIVGLAILATEFSWARRLLWRARRYASRVRSQAIEKIRERRLRSSSRQAAQEVPEAAPNLSGHHKAPGDLLKDQ